MTDGESTGGMTEIEIELDPETESRLREMAAERGIEMEELIREAVCRGLETDAADGVGAVYAPGFPAGQTGPEPGRVDADARGE